MTNHTPTHTRKPVKLRQLIGIAFTILTMLAFAGVTFVAHTEHKQVAVTSQQRWTNPTDGESYCGYHGTVIKAVETYPDGDYSQFELTCSDGTTVPVSAKG